MSGRAPRGGHGPAARTIGRPRGSIDRNGRAIRASAPSPNSAPWRALGSAFGHHLRSIREDRNIAASELAAAIGVSVMTVHAWERGRIPGIRALAMIACALDCTVVDLLPPEAHHRIVHARAA